MTAAMRRFAVLVSVIGVSACAGTSTAPQIPGALFNPVPPGSVGTYVAIGASDTIGIGADDPLRESWPHTFYLATMNRATTYYNLGISGLTTDAINVDEVPRALSLHPTVITVFVGVNDVIDGVSSDDFSAGFTQLMTRLQSTGAIVLVANIPVLDSLPAVGACITGQSDSPQVTCPSDQAQRAGINSFGQLDARVAAYNAVITRGVTQSHAALVDLAALGDYVKADPRLVSDDGFHPSDAGHRRLAQAFATAYHTRISGS